MVSYNIAFPCASPAPHAAASSLQPNNRRLAAAPTLIRITGPLELNSARPHLAVPRSTSAQVLR